MIKFTENLDFVRAVVRALLQAPPEDPPPREAPSGECPQRAGCTHLGKVFVEGACFCVYDCPEAVLFEDCR